MCGRLLFFSDLMQLENSCSNSCKVHSFLELRNVILGFVDIVKTNG